ncbi:MAG: O-antigen ligase family protein [bacterium]
MRETNIYNPKHLTILFFCLLIFICIGVSFGLTNIKPDLGIIIVIGIALFVLSFLDTEIALYILIFSMLLSPEIGKRAVSGEGMTLRIEDFLLFIICFGWLAKNAYYKEIKEIGLIRETPLNPYIARYIIVCIISTAIGMIAGRVNLKTGFFFVLKYFEYIIVFFILVNHLHDKRQIQGYVIALLLTCLIVCIIAILQIPKGIRVTAPFEGSHGEPNTLGGYMLLMQSIVIGLFFALDQIDIKGGLAALGGIITIVILHTLSRSTWLAAFLILVFFLFFLKRKEKMLALFMIFVAALLLAAFAPSKVRDRVKETFIEDHEVPWREERILGKTVDQSTAIRISGWKDGIRDWLTHHFIFGYGITGYRFMDAQYVRVAVESGIIGLITFFGLLFALFKYAFISYKKVESPLFKGLSLGYMAGLVGLLGHCIGTNTFIIVRIMEPFWFLTGIVIMLPELEKQQKGEDLNRL